MSEDNLNKLQIEIAKLYNYYSLVVDQQKKIEMKYPHATPQLHINAQRKTIQLFADKISYFWGISGWPKIGDLGIDNTQNP